MLKNDLVKNPISEISLLPESLRLLSHAENANGY